MRHAGASCGQKEPQENGSKWKRASGYALCCFHTDRVSHSFREQWAGRNVKQEVKVLRVWIPGRWFYVVIEAGKTGLFLNCKNNQGKLNMKCLFTNERCIQPDSKLIGSGKLGNSWKLLNAMSEEHRNTVTGSAFLFAHGEHVIYLMQVIQEVFWIQPGDTLWSWKGRCWRRAKITDFMVPVEVVEN